MMTEMYCIINHVPRIDLGASHVFYHEGNIMDLIFQIKKQKHKEVK